MTKWRFFLITFLLTTAGWSAVFYSNRLPPLPELQEIAPRVLLAPQLKPDNMRSLRMQGVRGIVDLRPDGEETGQPSSSEMEVAAKARGFVFHYIPVPHETIPDEAVDALGKVLSDDTWGTTVIYCRSGRRAVRTFALAEASRAGGPSVEEINKIMKRAGFSADDLQESIVKRISRRVPVNPEKKP